MHLSGLHFIVEMGVFIHNTGPSMTLRKFFLLASLMSMSPRLSLAMEGEKKWCLEKLQQERRKFAETTIPLNWHVAKRFIAQMDVFYPHSVPRETAYVLATLFNVFAARQKLDPLASVHTLEDRLRALSVEHQAAYFTLLKYHPLLTKENPPSGTSAPFLDFAPFFLPANQKEVLVEVLDGFTLPNYHGDFLKLSPLVKADLVGFMSLSFLSGEARWNYEIQFLNEDDYVLKAGGETIVQSGWHLEDGVIHLDDIEYEIHVEDASSFMLRSGYSQLSRIKRDGSLGIVNLSLH